MEAHRASVVAIRPAVFYSVFTCFFGGKLLPASTGITLRVHVLVAEDRSYRLHSRCPSSAAAPASSPTSASGFSALAGSPGYDCTLLARYFRYAYVCPLTTLVFSCSRTSAAPPSFSMGYARHHHLRFTSSSAVWFSLSSSFSFFPPSQHGGKWPGGDSARVHPAGWQRGAGLAAALYWITALRRFACYAQQCRPVQVCAQYAHSSAALLAGTTRPSSLA